MKKTKCSKVAFCCGLFNQLALSSMRTTIRGEGNSKCRSRVGIKELKMKPHLGTSTEKWKVKRKERTHFANCSSAC